MTTDNSVKKALVASILSIMICISTLIGSTYAWFTDSVSSGKNKIVAGNLDIGLEYLNSEGQYVPVTQDLNLFETGALWEPGHVEVVNLRVSNLGTLALKYSISIGIESEVGGINKDEESFKLSDYIYFSVLNEEKLYSADESGRAAALDDAAEGAALISVASEKSAVLYPKGKETEEVSSEKELTVILYMPANTGNAANYKTGTTPPSINLGINLFATQIPFEKDGFSDQYDAGAWVNVSTPSDFVKALTSGGKIVLEDDLTVSKSDAGADQVVISADTIIDLNGNSLNVTNVGTAQKYKILVAEGATLTINGDSESEVKYTGRGETQPAIFSVAAGGSLILNGGNYNIGNGTGAAIGVNIASGGYFEFNSGSIIVDSSAVNGTAINIKDNATVIMNGGYASSNGNVVALSVGSNFTMNGGTLVCDRANTSRGAISGSMNAGLTTINGGEIIAPLIFGNSQNQKAVVNGGTFVSEMLFNAGTETGTTLTINGGTFTGTNPDGAVVFGKGQTFINGGDFVQKKIHAQNTGKVSVSADYHSANLDIGYSHTDDSMISFG